MSVRVDMDGMAGFFRAIDAGASRAVGRAAAVVQRGIVNSFGRSGSGGGPIGRVTNIPSAPGSPPNVQTGHLRNSIAFNIKSPIRAAVGTNVEYGYWLEFGTTKMLARPFLRPIVMNRRVMDSARSAAIDELRRSLAAAKSAAMGGAA